MRAYFALLLAVIVLAACDKVSGSATHLRTPQNLIGTVNGIRALQANAKTDESVDPNDEERGALTSMAKMVGNWLNDKKLSAYVMMKSSSMDIDGTVTKFLQKNINPDLLYQKYSLSKAEVFTHEYTIWAKYYRAYQKKNPKWVSKITEKPSF